LETIWWILYNGQWASTMVSLGLSWIFLDKEKIITAILRWFFITASLSLNGLQTSLHLRLVWAVLWSRYQVLVIPINMRDFWWAWTMILANPSKQIIIGLRLLMENLEVCVVIELTLPVPVKFGWKTINVLVFYVWSRLVLLVALEEFGVCGVLLNYMLFLHQNIMCASLFQC